MNCVKCLGNLKIKVILKNPGEYIKLSKHAKTYFGNY